jgi:creatinine amidohydrolase
VDNLRLKVLEGMLLPLPPLFDLLEVAHGPLQQALAGRATFLAFERARERREGEQLERLAGILAPERHRLVRLMAHEPGPCAVFEHEALMNALLLRFIAEREVDQVRWPGRGRDAPLYDVGDALAPAHTLADDRVGPLEALTWPDVERRLREGHDTAVLPLGSTEQHGLHLPLGTDTCIAQALADRFCARFPEAVALPTLPFGCAREHLSFSGTLSLEEATLIAVLRDVARSVASHGFARLVVLSAHGGNQAALAAAASMLREEFPRLGVIAIGLADISTALYAASHRRGVAPEAAGRHAGEIETSIMLALAPAATRRERLLPGLLDATRPSEEIFYPDLRAHAPDGTVGDPRVADASRAEPYLDAWSDAIADHYRREKNRK